MSPNDSPALFLPSLCAFCKLFILCLSHLLSSVHSKGIRLNPPLISSYSPAQPPLVIHNLFLWFLQLQSTMHSADIFISPQIAHHITPAKNNFLAAHVLKMGNFTDLFRIIVKTHCLFLPIHSLSSIETIRCMLL